MSHEPWNDEIYNSEEKSRRSRTEKGKKATAIFTVLAVLFCMVVIGITVFAIYLSNGGSNTNSNQEFFNASKSNSTTSSEATSSSTTSTESSSEAVPSESSTEMAAEEGETLIVQEGEGEASIAERAGISIADLERLNPDKMSTGSWLAHPGDVVRIK